MHVDPSSQYYRAELVRPEEVNTPNGSTMSKIETTYIRIKTASDLLATDIDTLLIAAVERRIALYALTNIKSNDATCDDDNIDPNIPPFDCSHYFQFSQLIDDTNSLLKTGTTTIKSVYESIRQSGKKTLAFWADLEEPIVVDVKDLFMRRADVNEILAASSPPEPEPPKETRQTRSADTTRTKTLLTIIAALCNDARIDYKKPGTAALIEGLTAGIGTKITAQTIKAALDQIPDALERRLQ